MQKKQEPLPFKFNVLAGALAGACELVTMYPLDVVKTRAQQTVGGKLPIGRSLQELLREGGPARLYREPMKRAVKFSANEEFSKLVTKGGPKTRAKAALAGSLAGVSEAFVIAPFEVVKIRLQSKNRTGVYRNTLDCAKKMLAEEGAVSFTRGLSVSLQRNAVWNGTYFGVIDLIKSKFSASTSKTQNLLNSFVSGLFGGIFATTFNTPFDVISSRVRNVLPGEWSPYRFTYASMVYVAKNEGITALWRGYVAKVLRLGPGGGILLVVFDLLKDFMQQSR